MGHAYSSIIADFFARFKRIDGFEVHFLTGTDEHGLKIQRAAEKKGIEPLKFCDEISQTFRSLSKLLNLTNTDFIRTTEKRHFLSVQNLWEKLKKNDDIYLSKYSGWYSVSDEAFYSDDEVEDINGQKQSIVSKSKVEWMDEESFFFRLSKWQKPLLEYYKNNPEAMQALQSPVLEDKVVDFIIELADVTEKEVTIEELMQNPDGDAASDANQDKPKKKKAAKKKAAAKSKAKKGKD